MQNFVPCFKAFGALHQILGNLPNYVRESETIRGTPRGLQRNSLGHSQLRTSGGAHGHLALDLWHHHHRDYRPARVRLLLPYSQSCISPRYARPCPCLPFASALRCSLACWSASLPDATPEASISPGALPKTVLVDSLFVFLTIISSFKVPLAGQQKAWLSGIVLSLLARTGFMFLGAALLNSFCLSVLYLWADSVDSRREPDSPFEPQRS